MSLTHQDMELCKTMCTIPEISGDGSNIGLLNRNRFFFSKHGTFQIVTLGPWHTCFDVNSMSFLQRPCPQFLWPRWRGFNLDSYRRYQGRPTDQVWSLLPESRLNWRKRPSMRVKTPATRKTQHRHSYGSFQWFNRNLMMIMFLLLIAEQS